MIWIKILLIPVIGILGIIIGLLYSGIDRILAARMQSRVGPPVIQPFLDIRKLMIKENIIPENSIPWLFNLMPVLCLASTIVILLYLPFGFEPLLRGDLILILYLLIIPALCKVIAGFSSGSNYAWVGAQREMVMMMSYEFPLAITIISIAYLFTSEGIANPFSIQTVISNPCWSITGVSGFLGLVILFLVLLFVMPAELAVIPFDLPEASQEIAGGILAEYSGRNLALFYLAGVVKAVVFGSIIIALFFPYGLNIPGITGILADLVFFFVKLFLLVFIGSTFIRVAASRLKISQVVYTYWVVSVLVSLFGLLLIVIDIL